MLHQLDFWHGAAVSAISIGLGARALDYLTGTDTGIVAVPALCMGILLYGGFMISYWKTYHSSPEDR